MGKRTESERTENNTEQEEIILIDEQERIKTLLFDFGVKKEKVDLLIPVIINVVWMEQKLNDAMELIADSSVAIPYDNGGGQSGIRENPLFKGYESLFKSYMSGLCKILECLPNDIAEQIVEQEKPKSVLELVRDKHKKEA